MIIRRFGFVVAQILTKYQKPGLSKYNHFLFLVLPSATDFYTIDATDRVRQKIVFCINFRAIIQCLYIQAIKHSYWAVILLRLNIVPYFTFLA